MKKILILALVAGCAAPLQPVSNAAKQIQIIDTNSPLAGRCKLIAPLNASGSDFDQGRAEKIAGRQLLEQSARLGADSFIISNKGTSVSDYQFHVRIDGAAAKCY